VVHFLDSHNQSFFFDSAKERERLFYYLNRRKKMTRREQLQKFYKSKEWVACRSSYKAEHPLCERCLAEGRIEPTYIIHHKIYLTVENMTDPTVALNHDNLEALCFDCHNKQHFKKAISSRWKFIDGELKIIDE
jgi:5-methylcytosine-specific restriction endonuclease McrA